ncbi:glycosyltransferase family 4 protein [Sphingorhabdus pulchriflava]|uniref:Glycosyltransferase family 4 protein n=1 Tax=Sphingorhabdus pulchriflava TaxID=2292257 RepID=A0A371BI34_9SPHN|nr:glycosyltransferase [Sphingorhabdus pulchriflava]RDV07239.1 glycosyltransferase family 4 protein [Sphingorhabdus pulchriflava]
MNAISPQRGPVYHASPSRFSEPRVALVHYWFVSMRGGERVVERLLGLYPQADIFTHVYNPDLVSATISKAKVTTSFINRLPGSRRFYQYYLPLMPMALEQLDLSEYDLVISSESGPAKGVITTPDSLHVCYCHSPMRYLWDHYHQYRNAANPLSRLAMPPIYHWLRQWDVSSSARIDRLAANSEFVRRRIAKVWRRDAEVIHPPVETSLFTPSNEIDDYYLWVGAMVPYKRPDVAVDAFTANGRPLLMVGQGSMLRQLKARAGPNIRFVDRLDFNALRRAYARARAFVITAEEDFGIAPVEAMASGRPVVAYGRGGALDTVVPDRTGVFFDRQEIEYLIAAVEEMELFLRHFDPRHAVAEASRFAPEFFDQRISRLIADI